MYIKSSTKPIELMEPKNEFVQVPKSFFHSNIYNWCRRRSTAILRKTSVECIEKQAIRTVGLAHPSPHLRVTGLSGYVQEPFL